MFIKQIVIQGFKSYKEQTSMEQFSPSLNVIVGRNGSGKSNFFFAIRFVLADTHQNMSREERQSLLHESNQLTISAYVEIIFDNTDARFPINSSTVTLRRTIGLKKDEYSLDKKTVTKTEVLNLLDSAGFSRSNPYYIVPQGRIAALTNSKDGERLNLLKEVAGTKVYEVKRLESVKIMGETHAKRDQIHELLEFIETRMAELEEEKIELALFLRADGTRRGLEYALYSREKNDVDLQLAELNEARISEQELILDRHRFLADRLILIEEIQNESRSSKEKLKLLQLSKDQGEEDLQEAMIVRAKLTLACQDLQGNSTDATQIRLNLLKEQKQVSKEILTKQRELAHINPIFDDRIITEGRQKETLNVLQSEYNSLESKQGRFDRFSSSSERDTFLTNQIRDSKASEDQITAQRTLLGKSLGRNKNEVVSLETEITDLITQLDSRREEISEIDESFKLAQHKKNECEARKKCAWRDEARVQSQLDSLAEKVESTRRLLFSTMDRATSKGHSSVTRIVDRLKLKGYYGPLYDLFTVDEALETATEVVGGGSLFHLVVDSDETASIILKELEREGGRVTFMPLNRLNPKSVTYPDSELALPLISKLEYHRRFQKAMEQVFGKAVVCPDLQTASTFAKSHQLTAVTFNGDRADRKGALTGGFHDFRSTRLAAVRSLVDARAKMDVALVEGQRIKTELNEVEGLLLSARDCISEIDGRRRFIVGNRPVVIKEIEGKKTKCGVLVDLGGQIERQLSSLGEELKNLGVEILDARNEIGSPMLRKLSAIDSKRLAALPALIKECEAKLTHCVIGRSELQAEKSQLEFAIHNNLERRALDLESRLAGLVEAGSDDLSAKSRELEAAENSMGVLTASLDQITDEFETLKDSIEELTLRLEQSRNEQMDDTSVIEKQQLVIDRFLAKKSLLNQKKETALTHIRTLGVLPDSFEEYDDMEQNAILKSLHAVHETLKKFEHVNKKAHEQYGNFTNQRETLEERKRELDDSAKSIEALIETLDQRKNEAIEQTFAQVALHFAAVWKRLVPEGEGELAMIEKDDVSVRIY